MKSLSKSLLLFSIFSLALALTACGAQPSNPLTVAATASESQWTQDTVLDAKELAAFIKNPDAFKGKVSAELIRIGKDSRMMKSYRKVVSAVRSAGAEYDLANEMAATIRLESYSDGKDLYIWMFGDADDRGDSTLGVRIEYSLAKKAVTLWTKVEFTDHP